MNSSNQRIYLDWNASAPLADEAKAAFISALDRFGNPSSQHAEGRDAKNLLEQSREEVAAFMGCKPSEVIFTSGGTEANNLALACLAENAKNKTFFAAKIEHPSVLRPLEALEADGWKDCWAKVDPEGFALPSSPLARIGFGTIQAANHETGAVQRLDEFSDMFDSLNVPWHCDASQAWSRISLSAEKTCFSTATLSSHKLGAPKGVGALFVRKQIAAKPLFRGGPQERKFRAGTENLPGIAALAAACRVAALNMKERSAAMSALRRKIVDDLVETFPGLRINGPADSAQALPNTVNISLPGIDGRILVHALDLDGVAASSGSACSSGALGPSAVLLAMGASDESAKEGVRISFGHSTTEADLQNFTIALKRIVGRIKGSACG